MVVTIEDDVLVGQDGPVALTEMTPKTVAEPKGTPAKTTASFHPVRLEKWSSVP